MYNQIYVNICIHPYLIPFTKLLQVHAVCIGERKQTNHLRGLIAFLNKGLIPNGWIRYVVPKGITVMSWIYDFSERIIQLITLTKSDSLKVNFECF